MACIKMGSDESHFTVSLIVSDKVIRPCPQITIRMWFRINLYSKLVHSFMVYTKHAPRRAISRGSSHVTTKQPSKYTTSLGRLFPFPKASTVTNKQTNNNSNNKNKRCVITATVIHSESHTTRAQWVSLEAGNGAIVAIVKRLGLILIYQGIESVDDHFCGYL